jgi:glycerol-1-phosphate dehydrogenase [NAD(P)+]
MNSDVWQATQPRTVAIPKLVRIEAGALDRVGRHLRQQQVRGAAVLCSEGLPGQLIERLTGSLNDHGISVAGVHPIPDASREFADDLLDRLGEAFDVTLGLGGGKATDTAKYISHRLETPYVAIPTSLSNDGFCSPQSSMTVDQRRTSIPTMMPSGVIVDLDVCLQAPKRLWLSGVGDLVSTLTAVRDWRLAFSENATPFDDFAALLSDSSVYQFIARPTFDREGTRRLATALMLNGVSMAVCESSRPASGSEHLISHALDAIDESPELHGVQVGIATYWSSLLHGFESDTINRLFSVTGFWDECWRHPRSKSLWTRALYQAPQIKRDFYTILDQPGCLQRAESLLEQDPNLRRCFQAEG